MSLLRSVVFSLLSLGCLALTSCGFEPVYGNRLSSTTLGNMIVEPIAGREGQIFKIAMEDALNPESADILNAPYALRVNLKRDVIPAVIADDASIRRYNVLMTAEFAVIDRATSKSVYQGNARRFGSYSRSTEDFSTFVADEDISKRTLESLAQDIAQRISALSLPTGQAL